MKIESFVREVVVIDHGVEDHETLVCNLRKGIKTHFLNHLQDGVVQLTNILKQYSNLDAIHIVSHGHSGCLILGNSQLTSETLGRYQKLLFSWQQALNNSADILLYGCEVGKGEAGEAFIQQLAAHTHANIAASTNLTGNKQLNGDWELGYRVGSVSAQFPFNACIIESYPAVLPTVESFTGFVNGTNRAPSFTFNGFTYAINDPSPSPSDLREMVSGGDPLLELGGGLGTTIFSIARADGSEFSLSSLTIRDQHFLGDTYSVSGWRDGVKVTANHNHTLTGTNTNTNSFSGASDTGFLNIDRIEFAGMDVGFSLEDWTFGAAVGSPTVTSATYNAATNSLVVTGTNLTATAGALNDINVAKLTLNGQDSASYTLTSSNVEIDSATQFTVGLNTTDQINVEGLLNNNGSSAVDATTFNIAAADDWNSSQAGNADLTGNAVNVSNVQMPTITSATYNANTGSLAITGTNLVKASGAVNDITANKFTLTGEGGATYTLTDSANVEITSGTAFTLTLSATDRAAVNQILNKNGTISTDVSTYNLSAADDWNTVIGNADISDIFGNGITVSNVAAPTITSATYDASTGSLVVTGTGFLSSNGAANDIIANKFTLTGEGGATYTLTDSANVEITSGTAFTLTLSATDRAAINQILNKNGSTSTDISTYNLAAVEDWAAGADAAVVVADLTGNGITVSNVAAPTITSAAYDASTGSLVVSGTDFLSSSGTDIIANKFTLTGEGGATYTLTDSANVEITSGTAFTLTLSATDRSAVNQILNKNGTTSTDISTYNLAAAEDWAAGADAAVNIVDATGNGITVSNVAVPTITSAAYDASTGALVVTGTDFLSSNGAANDIIANKFTLTGEGGATYTLTDSADVEIASGTTFTISLSATDRAAVNQMINKNGTSSNGATTYNLAAAEDWAAGADAAVVVADLTGNGITVSNVAAPTITSATYDASTGSLVVAGTGFLSSNGAANDIIANKFTLTGEGGATYTLSDSANVEITSGTAFTLTLSATDRAAVNQMINKNGSSSNDATTYNLAAAEDWAAGADAAVNIVDATGNGITVSNVAAPTITSAAYDASTGALIVTGTGFLSSSGVANDIIANKFTLTGEGGATYTLTDSADVEITSGTAFTLTLSATDRAAVNQILNKNGTTSTDISTYNLAAAEDWAAGADAAVVVADLTGNGVTVSSVAAPTITSAAYDASTGSLIVTGTGFLSSNGAANDIIANKFTLTGEGGATYTLTDSANVEITSGTAFTLTLSATDRAAVNQILNKNGTTSTGISTYNLAAAEDWAAGADAAVNIVDASGNGITVSNVAAPTIMSAAYDASTGSLVVSGTDFLSSSGTDIIANKFTLTGEGGATYTLTDSANVEITSGTAFTLTLSATDRSAVNQILNKNGTTSTDISTYNLAAAEDWAAGADAAVNIVDATGNGITVSNVAAPMITSAAYDASTGALVVSGTDFLSSSGTDIIANKFTLTGEGGATYTLTDSTDVEVTSGTAFTLTLSATDKAAVNQFINKNGTSSNGATTYNLAAAEDWAAGADAAVVVADLTGNGVTVSNVAAPTITSAAYDASTGALIVTGTGFLSSSGVANDIIANKFTLTGEGGATYTLTDSANVEITSGTAFTLTLSATDKAAVNQIINKNGTSSNGATTYNLAAAEDWAAGADAAVNIVDGSGNGITVSNVAAPTITSAAYDASTGALIVTGTGFLSSSGVANDIIANKFTLTGEGGATYTLTDSANVEITSGTAFTVTLSAADRSAVNQILNTNGTTSTDISTYNLAAAEDWAAGADAAVVVADLTGNGVTVSNVAAPTITSAAYDASTGSLVVSGTDFLSSSGTDIIANKFTLTGEGGATYTLTDSANVEITSGTAFTLTLSATDRSAVNQILNKNGTTSTDISTYNLAAAEDWAAGADAAVNIVDATGNGITVSNVAVPTITSAAYDASTGALVVTGTDFLSSNGAANDIIANKFTLTGEGGATYTLSDSANVEITSGAAFTLTLSTTDKAAVNQLINKNGPSSNDATTYNLAAAEDWAAGADAAVNIVDASGNGITATIPTPAITSATYDASTGTLIVTGTDFLSSSGAANDIIANKFTLTGEGGATYTLSDSANVEITSGTAFTLTLSATDRAAVNQILNKNGTTSTDISTYNLAAAEDWAAGADAVVNIVDATGNGITVSNVAAPMITSAAYDASTGALVVSGTDFLSSSGTDIIANKFTLTGEGGATYTLTDSTDVEVTSGTAFTLTLSATDKAAVNQFINKNGTSSNGATTYNLAAAEDWAAGADAAVVVADLTGNGVTVSNVAAPTITSAAYDASTGALIVTGTGFLSSSGVANDIIANKFTLTGEGGATYTLTDSANVEITSGTAFTLTLSATDKAAVNQIINKNGTSSNGATTYNLAAAEDWAAGADAAVNIVDGSGNGITVSNVAAPTITSAAYDASTGALIVTGTGFLSSSGVANDIIANKFTLTGEGGATYTLTDSANVEITSGTAFTVTLSAADRSAVNQILNTNGTTSTDISTYNLAAAEDWAAGADAAVVVADLTGNGVTVSNVAAPTITSAAYDAGTGALVVTGTGFLSSNGAANDIIANKFTLTGEDGATYTLTDSADVEITSGTVFTLTLSAADRAAVNQMINKNGSSSNDATTYNLAAAEDWAAGADAAVVVADLTGNGITATVPAPTITSAAYDASTGALVVTGTDFLSSSGTDIIANKFTLTGEGGATYTLTDSADVEIASGTTFTISLSATDRAAVNQMINKNGTSSNGATTYNLAAAEDWAAGADAAVVVADLTGNGITVSNVAAPTITSATYDASTGSLVVAGTGFLSSNGAANDIIANKFTLTGEGGATYTLSDSANVEITSGTAFTLTLSATDRAAVNQMINKNGSSSNDATTYNLAAAEDWAAGADAAVNIVDATGNGITVSNVAAPTITSAAYDASTGALIVTGTGFLSSSGVANDIIANKFTLTGEGGATYTLTDSADVEITSGTAFTLTLSATDRAAVNQILNKNGTTSTDISTYNLAAAEDWAAGADAAVVVADLTGNGVTVSSVAAPTITSAAYDASTGALVVTGTGFLFSNGATNDIIANKFTLTGEGGATYTLTDSADVEITSGTAFTLTLGATGKAAVNQILNRNGTTSTDISTYNLAAAEDWAAGADAAVVVADLTGNGVTVSNVAAPTITSAAYNASTGVLVVAGTNLVSASGGANDIDVSKFTITGQGGTTYTLTDSADVEITSGTAFTLTLSATDKAAVNQIINKNGTSSNDATTYNLAAAEDWAAGADAVVNIVDATGNGITATVPATPPTPTPTPNPNPEPEPEPEPEPVDPIVEIIDGANISRNTEIDGSITSIIIAINESREEDPTSLYPGHADIPILNDINNDPILVVSLPTGVGLSMNGQPGALSTQNALNDLIARIEQQTEANSGQRNEMIAQGQRFLSTLTADDTVVVQTFTPTVSNNQTPSAPIIFTSSNADNISKQAIVIDARNLPSNTVLQLDNVSFSAILGEVSLVGGSGQNYVIGDDHNQFIVLGENDDILSGGGGSDTVGSLGGEDQVNGDTGNDVVYGGSANDILSGGLGDDQLNGGFGFDIANQSGILADYNITTDGSKIIFTHNTGEIDTFTDVELIRFENGETLAISNSVTETAAHHLAKTWLNRDLTPSEGIAIQNWQGANIDNIITAFHSLSETIAFRDKTASELLAGFEENPTIIQLDVSRDVIASNASDQGYLPLGLALNVDGNGGHDVLQMQGKRSDVSFDKVIDALEITQLSDGAMLNLKNAEMIAFDSGENIILAHNQVEGILGRLVQTFFDRDATISEWQLGREALASNTQPHDILEWFQSHANLRDLSDSDYINKLYDQTFGRLPTENELNTHITQLNDSQIDRNWLAVELASSDEAISVIGSVILLDGGI